MPVPSKVNPVPQTQATAATPKSPSVGRKDYQPLRSVKLPGVEIRPKGLILVVGPNSSGKTQLLKDIYSLLSGEQRKSVVCEQIEVDKPTDLNQFLDELVELRYLKRYRDANGAELVEPSSPLIGFGPVKRGQTYINQIQGAFTSFQAGPFTTHSRRINEFRGSQQTLGLLMLASQPASD